MKTIKKQNIYNNTLDKLKKFIFFLWKLKMKIMWKSSDAIDSWVQVNSRSLSTRDFSENQQIHQTQSSHNRQAFLIFQSYLD